MIGPVKPPPRQSCVNGHLGAWMVSENTDGWRWKCRECNRVRQAKKRHPDLATRHDLPPTGWESMRDAFEMWQWDYSGDALVRRVAEQCGVTVPAVLKALHRHPGYVRPDAA